MRIVCLITILLSLPLTARAQTTATLAGRVLDTSGGVLPGALVTARQTDTGLARAATTGPDGRYTLTTLPVGAYEIRADLEGFRPMLRQGDAHAAVGYRRSAIGFRRLAPDPSASHGPRRQR